MTRGGRLGEDASFYSGIDDGGGDSGISLDGGDGGFGYSEVTDEGYSPGTADPASDSSVDSNGVLHVEQSVTVTATPDPAIQTQDASLQTLIPFDPAPTYNFGLGLLILILKAPRFSFSYCPE